MTKMRTSFSVRALAVALTVIMIFSAMVTVFNANAASWPTRGSSATTSVAGGGKGKWATTNGTISVNGTNALSVNYRNQKVGYAVYLPENYEEYANNADGKKLAVMLVMSGGTDELNAKYYYMANTTGLNYLADEKGIILVYVRQNNYIINTAYAWTWWQPSDYTRNTTSGYVPQRVTELVKSIQTQYGDYVDTDRTYVTGLSAGACMAATFAALYPDVYAGAAIVGGTPFKCVTVNPISTKRIMFAYTYAYSYQHAYNAMHYGTGGITETPYEFEKDVNVLGKYITEAWAAAGVSAEDATRVAIFHGTADETIRIQNGRNIANANAIARFGNTDTTATEARTGYTAFFYGTDSKMVAEGYSNDRASAIALYEVDDVEHVWVSANSTGDWCQKSDVYDYNEMMWEFFEGSNVE
ncbi:MAG: hypothetical protein IKY44_01645 [Clostridia bacterium]|nr:hypothetical protein [Clostridia bacterium]